MPRRSSDNDDRVGVAPGGWQNGHNVFGPCSMGLPGRGRGRTAVVLVFIGMLWRI